MKKTLRITIVLLLSLTLYVCLMPSAFAEGETAIASGTCGAEGDNLTWKLYDSGELVIEGTGRMQDFGDGTAPWFKNRLSITSVTIHEGVTSIGNKAFYYCTKLSNISIPGSVSRIEAYAFDHCVNLTNITIPNGVTYLGSYAFNGCSNLINVDISDSVTYIREYSFFNCSSLANVTIPEGVMNIGYSAFQGCNGLVCIDIPDSVTSIGSSAFYGCSALTSIKISNNIKSIPNSAFSGCSSLASIDIPDSVTAIGNSAFSGCSDLANIKISNSTIQIYDYAFSGCSSLTSIDIPDSVTTIGSYAFSDCSSLTEIHVDSGNSFYSDVDGVLCDLDATKILHFPRGRQGVYKIPTTVTNIDSGTFSNCVGLTSIIIPDGITSIEVSTFYNCTGLRSITIPITVTSIGDNAFEYCGQLSAVCYSGTEEQWQIIAIGYWNAPLRNANIYYNCTSEKTYEITFKSNDENATVTSQIVPEGTAAALNLNPFIRDGYVFIGWSTAPEGTVEYADGAIITVEQNMPLYAQWAEAITITFNGNGYNSWASMPDQTVPKNIPTALKKCTFQNDSAVFKGWGLSAGDRSVDFKDEDIVTLDKDITLYAIWEQIERIDYFYIERADSSQYNTPYCVGDTLTVSLNTASTKTYQWNRDGQAIPGATEKNYIVTPEDFLHRISCTVSIPTDTRTSDNAVLINIDVEQEIIDDGDTSLPYGAPGVIRGVFPGMRHTVNGGAEIAVPDSIQNSRLEVVEPGTYVFRYNNLESAPISVDAWYSISYASTSNNGGGTTNLRYGNISMSSSTITEDGRTIIRRYYADNIVGNCWLVRKDAAQERFTLTVMPYEGCYANISVNGGEISSYNEQTVIDIGILTAPVLCEITFTSSPLTPSIIVPIDEANFPDPVFRSFVSGRYDRDGDGMLSDTEIYNIWDLSISNYSISSLRGVENFTELRSLYCSSNNLTELNLSGCAALNSVNCNANVLTSLNLSGCTGLRSLNCANNSLRELDVSDCPLLETLDCSTNMLSGLDLSSNSALMSLSCSDNYFTSLNLAGIPALTTLICNGNVLNRLDLTLNPPLVSVICTNNLMTGLDVSDCPYLRTLRCGNNMLTWLDLSGCPSIMTLDCSGNSIETLILDGCTALTSLNCSNNRLQALALDGTASLSSLSCSANQLEVLDVSGLGNLTALNCQNNQIDVIDVSDCMALRTLNCTNNLIKQLDVADCAMLRTLNCTNNLLRQLDVTGCYSMKTLQCERNLLTSLDLSGCEALKTLHCSNNGLTQLDITDCTLLVELVKRTEPQTRNGIIAYGTYDSGIYTSDTSGLSLSIDQNVVLIYPHSIASDPDLILPSFLTTIEDEAFAGGAFKYVMLPEGAKTIGWHAFVNCPNLLYIYIPEGIESIDAHAFDGADRLTIIGVPGSSAESFAQLHGFAFKAAE